jgi:hypothetical protein
MVVGTPVVGGYYAPVYGYHYGFGSSLFFCLCFPCILIFVCIALCCGAGKNVEINDNNYA